MADESNFFEKKATCMGAIQKFLGAIE